MKQFLFTAIVMTGLVLGACASRAADDVNWSALPSDKAALMELDTQQARALGASVRQCEDFARSNHAQTACVFLDLDRSMRQSDDAALRAYHFALPRGIRYDDARNQGFAAGRVAAARENALD
ncbi:MAG: hypothetical protein CVT73_10215 [Alphaproteobacteria bacterium HGW-Alphaproteobacteria-12]|nr:MAG: hypothetical protein CVT73_10215 [Alphaproteobacteria bacterium HGW-Alphaproteobacteria-12]